MKKRVLSLLLITAILATMLTGCDNKIKDEINKLQKQQQTLAESVNQSLAIMQQQINSLNTELFNLQQSLQNTEEDEAVDTSQNSQKNENKDEEKTVSNSDKNGTKEEVNKGE